MQPQRISVKLFLADGHVLNAALFVPVFQRWIQRRLLPGLLIDVVDYRHVHQGPGVILIGHEGDLGLDFGGGRPGLLYTRKRAHPSDPGDSFMQGTGLVLLAASLLRKERSLRGLEFMPGELQLQMVDRLRTPNSAQAYARLVPEIERFARRLYGAAEMRHEAGDPRANLTVTLRASKPATLDGLLARHAATSEET